ncbi:circadian clock-controlled protein daywake-like [Musca vetustissima]|uniref:circadian clock-controlled protein daywake-like n=1 Tax=Musca vetustissima TaxID=27455 RepID=UPI002AB6B279|nr:circadian clock-controlled protein daywake-like [Musca vetustissima]
MKLDSGSSLLVILATILVVAVVNGKTLTTKPDFLTQCQPNDSEFNRCLVRNFQAFFTEWKEGLLSPKYVGDLDPLFVKRIIMEQDLRHPVSMNANLHNLEVKGLRDLRVENVSFDLNELFAKATLVVPKLNIHSDYTITGRILSLALNGNGKAFIRAEHLEVKLLIRFKLRDEDGLTFMDVDKLHAEIKEVGGFGIRLDNLFHGQKVLEESAHDVFNENWHEFYEILRPAIKSAVETILTERLSKIFANVPATFIIGELPAAADYYG